MKFPVLVLVLALSGCSLIFNGFASEGEGEGEGEGGPTFPVGENACRRADLALSGLPCQVDDGEPSGEELEDICSRMGTDCAGLWNCIADTARCDDFDGALDEPVPSADFDLCFEQFDTVDNGKDCFSGENIEEPPPPPPVG